MASELLQQRLWDAQVLILVQEIEDVAGPLVEGVGGKRPEIGEHLRPVEMVDGGECFDDFLVASGGPWFVEAVEHCFFQGGDVEVLVVGGAGRLSAHGDGLYT